ncbi:hypothetical protein PPN31114_03903 [Pandoraea pneumonica]|uniref:DUF4148 domain-containing protein n=1 Tax=Pandoraea pneumonica TaxID=2508299 RepID=A0A5E4XIR2_9BURK|nr:DUF4148 domain-containing protein [Pandoraea pneumonica]VVE36058.1 hypothetical protein PPN31114_03903 [Pandoraea pneumonica]
MKIRKLALATSFAAIGMIAANTAVASSHSALTRAEVKAELKQLHDAGYSSAQDNTRYPANLMDALNNASRTSAASTGANAMPAKQNMAAMEMDRPKFRDLDAGFLNRVYRGS